MEWIKEADSDQSAVPSRLECFVLREKCVRIKIHSFHSFCFNDADI